MNVLILKTNQILESGIYLSVRSGEGGHEATGIFADNCD